MPLPHLSSERPYVTDGGLETTLIFHTGIDLPDFAAFPLVDSGAGRAALADYYTPYLALADRLRTGIVLDTPTWRASLDWGARLGYDSTRIAELNRAAVGFVRGLATDRPSVPAVINGVIELPVSLYQTFVIEERFGFTIHDDDMDSSVFATLGSLTDFVTAKLAG